MLEVLTRVSTGRAILTLATATIRRGAVNQGPAGRRAVALTFDDGPDSQFTPQILDILGKHGARATFFAVGKCAAMHPEIVARADREGHEIGSHLYHHRRDTVRDDDRFRDELERSLEVLRNATGKPVRFLRFPYGYWGRQDPRALERRGITVVQWTFSTLDSRATDERKIVERVASRTRPGAIILMHDHIADDVIVPPYRRERDKTVAALPAMLDLLGRRGYEMVTLSELLTT